MLVIKTKIPLVLKITLVAAWACIVWSLTRQELHFRRMEQIVQSWSGIQAKMDSAGVDPRCLIIIAEPKLPRWDGKKPLRYENGKPIYRR